MPTYDYKCNKCGHRFEVFQKMSDAPVKVCPECGGDVKKIISGGAGIHFKGSGFYVNDYKGKNSAGSATNTTSESKSSTTAK